MRRTSGGPQSNTSGSRAVARWTRANSSAAGTPSPANRRQAPDRLAAMLGERLAALGSQSAGQQRVVPDLGVRVERQVVGEQADVGLEQRLQPPCERAVDRSGSRTPEDPVVGEHQLRSLRRRAPEQLEMGAHAGGHRRHLLGPRHLQPVGAVVLEALRLQEAVELAHDVGDSGWHRRDDSRAAASCGILEPASGRGAAW